MKEYLDVIKPCFNDIINNLKKSDTSKIQLTITLTITLTKTLFPLNTLIKSMCNA